MFFKTLFCFIVISQATGCWAVPLSERIRITRNKCVERTGLSKDIIDRIPSFDYPSTPETQYYIRCVFENLEIWDAANGFLNENINEILQSNEHRDDIIDVIEDCSRAFKSDSTNFGLLSTMNCIKNGKMGKEFQDIIDQVLDDNNESSTTESVKN